MASLRRYAKGTLLTSPEGLTRVVALAHERGALAGKDVLAMGDDAAAAAAVALAGKVLSPNGRLARRVVALSPDERALTRLRDIAMGERAIIGLVTYDPATALLPDLEREFNTVFVDSRGDLASLAVLLSRAIDATKDEGGLIFLTLGPRPPEDRLEAQEALADMGLLIEELSPRFVRHGGEDSSRSSDLYVLRVTDSSAPLVGGEPDEPDRSPNGASEPDS